MLQDAQLLRLEQCLILPMLYELQRVELSLTEVLRGWLVPDAEADADLQRQN